MAATIPAVSGQFPQKRYPRGVSKKYPEAMPKAFMMPERLYSQIIISKSQNPSCGEML